MGANNKPPFYGLIRYLQRHEDEIFRDINDFGDLKFAFLCLVGRSSNEERKQKALFDELRDRKPFTVLVGGQLPMCDPKGVDSEKATDNNGTDTITTIKLRDSQ